MPVGRSANQWCDWVCLAIEIFFRDNSNKKGQLCLNGGCSGCVGSQCGFLPGDGDMPCVVVDWLSMWA